MWPRLRRSMPYQVLETAVRSYGADRVNRMAAAVAYRTMFALAPLLIVAVAVFGIVMGNSEEAREGLLATVEGVAGVEVANAVETLIRSALVSGDVTALVGFILFVWSASSLFTEVQTNLNDIFRVPHAKLAGISGFLKTRALSLLWAISLGLLLIVVWLVNAAWEWLASLLPEGLQTVGIGARLVSLGLLPLVFALIFRTLIRASVRWRAILVGSGLTALMFGVTAIGAGLYFSTGASAPQIAGAFFVVLLLAYLLSSVFLFGAQVTRVYNDRLDAGTSP
ncbi:MAG: YihY/virulence factor BrkB family protein [Actinobacteria bacterium]|nr:YihY/virulence factor BrkB family protein [Actinomycetota bacterium]